jgi:hypothetical protein
MGLANTASIWLIKYAGITLPTLVTKTFLFFQRIFLYILSCILTPNIPLCFLSLDTNNEWNMRWSLHKKLYHHMPYRLYNSLKTQKVLSYALPIIKLIKNTKSVIIICLTDLTTNLDNNITFNHYVQSLVSV